MKIRVKEIKNRNNCNDYDDVTVVYLDKMPLAHVVCVNGAEINCNGYTGSLKFIVDKYLIAEDGELRCYADSDIEHGYPMALKQAIKYVTKWKDHFEGKGKKYNRYPNDPW